MNAIVSVTSDWGIGLKGQLAVKNRDDMRRFTALTMGGTVIMGRHTLDSFPNGPLKGRRNIVLTHSPECCPAAVEAVTSCEEALVLVANEDPERVWLIGGQAVYAELISSCERAYVTKNDCVAAVDAYFPNLDADPAWVIETCEEGGVTAEGIAFSYLTYRHVT